MTDHDIELSDVHFTKLREIIHKNTGITIGEGRKGLLISRLRGRLRDVDEPNFKAYIGRVISDASEMQELIDRVTTNKTYFYRTPRIWEHFRTVVVPAFRAKDASRPMRVWSAAASTGEEAHTLGILLEDTRLSEDRFDYTIFGTDVSARVLKSAKTGVYEQPAINQFRKAEPDLFRKHVLGDDAGGYKVGLAIKSRLKFQLHNLQKALKNTSAFDAVFLRNVLIYFTEEDQENILRHVASMMQPDATLYIGESETLTRLKTRFKMTDPMVYQLETAGSRVDT